MTLFNPVFIGTMSLFLLFCLFVGATVYGQDACELAEEDGRESLWDSASQEFLIFEPVGYPVWEWFDDGSFWVVLRGIETGDNYRIAFPSFECETDDQPGCVIHGCWADRWN